MLHKKWVIRQADKEAASAISEQFNIDPFLAFLLVSRGLTDELAVQEFLHPGQALCAPEGFEDMEAAAARLQQALDSGERICVYGDYDCDGVTATALLFFRGHGRQCDLLYPGSGDRRLRPKQKRH